jgi:ABC-type transport system involved in multi-copper enzyme maturation permease subunit
MTGPFLALALDVPKRLARGWVLWILLGLTLLSLLLPLGLHVAHDKAQNPYITIFGLLGRPDPGEGAVTLAPEDGATLLRQEVIDFVGGLFGIALASYIGVFTGLVFFADAVTSAFAPGAAEITLTKPVLRSTVVLARFVGAVAVAAAFATLLVGGAILIAYARTGVSVATVLWTIPISVLQFAVLYAIGSAGGVTFRNALVAAFLGLSPWLAGGITTLLGKFDKSIVPFFKFVGEVSLKAHRVLPRAGDLADLAGRMTSGNFGDKAAGGTAGEAELVVNCLVWLGLGLGLAMLSVRRQDY